MKILNTLRILTRQYQTRKHLTHLPTHLLNDIALTAETSANELKKNSLLHFFSSALRQLIKGN